MTHSPDTSLLFWLLLLASICAMAARRFRIPYAVGLVVAGLLVGLPGLLPEAHLDPHLVFTLFLPPLLFEAALNLRTEALRESWRSIAALALVGTLLAAAASAALLHVGLGMPLLVALVFGALIAPTDPISVMAVLKQLGLDHRLGVLVEAESLFNDGVAVVLFTVAVALASGAVMSPAEAAGRFTVVLLGGAGLGLVAGLVASWVTRAFDDHLLEVTLTTLVAYGAYLGAEAVQVSGVMAVVVAGLVVGNWGMRIGMSPTTRLAVSTFWEYAAFVANSLVFLLVGLEAARVAWWTKLDLVVAAIVAVLAGRAVAVYVTAAGLTGLRQPVPSAWQHLLVWGGLRGALSMALALGLPAQLPHREALVAMTFGVVLFSLLAQGLTVGPLAARLGLAHREAGADTLHRLNAERLAWEAARREVLVQVQRGALPAPVAEGVAQEFSTRADRAALAIEALHLSDEAIRAAQTEKARLVGLVAARNALREAALTGILDGEAVETVRGEIDSALTSGGARLAASDTAPATAPPPA